MIIKICVKIIHTLGVFQGYLQTTENITRQEAEEVVSGMIESTGNITYLALIHSDGFQTVVSKNILETALVAYKVTEEYFKE